MNISAAKAAAARISRTGANVSKDLLMKYGVPGGEASEYMRWLKSGKSFRERRYLEKARKRARPRFLGGFNTCK